MISGGIWGLLVIVGPIVLLAAIIWAATHNRTSKRQLRETEEATRRLYEEEQPRNDVGPR